MNFNYAMGKTNTMRVRGEELKVIIGGVEVRKLMYIND